MTKRGRRTPRPSALTASSTIAAPAQTAFFTRLTWTNLSWPSAWSLEATRSRGPLPGQI
ncbi:MAG: hypothetical protein AVDCRST_MAG93-9000, partial [uncultured Chloroflexia bacterium]